MALFKSLLSALLLASQVAGLYPTVGPTGGVYPRLEIRDLAANYPQQYSLYIQALQALQNNGTTSLGSFYKIAGIHGAPNADWDGVTGNGGGYGYCAHGINIFPTWHRPYMALFEQQLQAFASSIALQYTTNQANWTNAAKQLRAPFYDWVITPASGKSAYPDPLYSKTVTITTPTGQKTVTNPNFSYKFPQTVPGFPPPYSTWPNTLRWPSSSASSATSQPSLARQTIDQNRQTWVANLYQMFTQCNDYSLLSDYRDDRPSNCPTSLETIHGAYHVFIGGTNDPNGHMSIVDFAGFDPAFMLHHVQVDRLFAMWQVLYPNSWVVNTVTSSNTRTIAQGSTVGPGSALTPFRNKAGQFWTSDTSRRTTTFNYTYPDLVTANGNSATMQQQINALYGPSATKTAVPGKKKRAAESSTEMSEQLRERALTDGIYEYTANIVTTRHGLGGSYAILVFFGNPSSSDPSTWVYDPNLIGSAGIFANQNMQSSDQLTSSSVSLTSALLKQNGIVGILSTLLPPSLVTPYLKKNLQWYVVKGGEVIDPKAVPNLAISVVSSLREPLSVGFPKWDSFQTLPEITAGKPGGVGA